MVTTLKVQTKGKIVSVLIDTADAQMVNTHTWHILTNPRTGIQYTRTNLRQSNGTYKGMFLHRLLMGITKSQIDHINGNSLDNRRDNLRFCTPQQNAANMKSTGSYGKGVYKNKDRYTVKIGYKRKRMYVGHYASVQEAKDAYDQKAIELFGEFALTNAMLDMARYDKTRK